MGGAILGKCKKRWFVFWEGADLIFWFGMWEGEYREVAIPRVCRLAVEGGEFIAG